MDLTHEIPTYNIWEAALRLEQTARYWPPGTVFVSVVDPGVGTQRKSVVLKTKSGHYFVTPDNGTLTFIAESLGIEAVREIDEAVNRLKNSDESYTFHGRDVYAYTGARLAAGVISFQEVGRELHLAVVNIPYQRAGFHDCVIKGNIPILDVQFGNIWTNIDRDTFQNLKLRHGDLAQVTITHGDTTLTLLGCLPANSKRLPFLFKRRKQRSAMLMSSGAVFLRLAFRSLLILAVRYPRWLASTNAVRKYRLPCLVIPKRWCFPPEEYSRISMPIQDTSWRGWGKRLSLLSI